MAEYKVIKKVRDLIALGEGAIGVTSHGKYVKYDFKQRKVIEVPKPAEPEIDHDDLDLDEAIAPKEQAVEQKEAETKVADELPHEQVPALESPENAKEPEFTSTRERLLFGGHKREPQPQPQEHVVAVQEPQPQPEPAPEVVAEPEVVEAPEVVAEPDSIEKVITDFEALLERLKQLD